MDKLQCDEKEASSVILESIPTESIDTLIESGLNSANDDSFDDVHLADGCSTCKTEIFRSFLTHMATNTDEIFCELSNKLLRQALDEQLSKLTSKEAEVIKLRFEKERDHRLWWLYDNQAGNLKRKHSVSNSQSAFSFSHISQNWGRKLYYKQ